ncbi:MAG: universal stress protein [Flavobacteriaceae bacterium]|nr:universal stress protein [Flavobacteriaceae bacterium]
MRKLLIPTDFSENALNAIKNAVVLFKYEQCEIFLMHAYIDELYDAKKDHPETEFEALKKEIHTTVELKMDVLLSEVKKFSPNPKHNFIPLLLNGTLIDELNDIVDRENIDLLLMGTLGQANHKNKTFGSNTIQVLKYVKCPVMAIPKGFSSYAAKKLLFTTDFQLPYKRRELKLISTLAKSFVAKIDFLYVSDFKTLSHRQEDNKAFLDSCFRANLTEFHSKQDDDLTHAINKFINEHEIDLLIMVNSRHSFLENILYQSTIDAIGLHIKIPFLVLQNLKR